MANTRNIAEFTPADGLTPQQTNKLNYNFRALLGVNGTSAYWQQSGGDMSNYPTWSDLDHYCPLDQYGKVPTSRLPDFVDDVIDADIDPNATPYSSTWLVLPGTTQTIQPEGGKIYVIVSTEQLCRWDGSAYVIISGNMSAADKAKLDALPDNATLSATYATKTEVAGALQYQGTATAETAISNAAYKKGWYWIVAMPNAQTTSITIAGQTCEAGDMVIAKQDKTSTLANDLDIVQSNIVTITNAEIDTICV